MVVFCDIPVTVLLALLPTALIAGVLRKFRSDGPDITETDLLYHTLWTLGTPAFISVGLLIRWLT